jgi:hypothetical protein
MGTGYSGLEQQFRKIPDRPCTPKVVRKDSYPEGFGLPFGAHNLN